RERLSLPPSPESWISLVLATVAVPPWTVTAPLFTRIVPPASRETATVLSRASPMTVNTPFAAENVAVNAGRARYPRTSSEGTNRPCQGFLRPRGETERGLGRICFQNLRAIKLRTDI